MVHTVGRRRKRIILAITASVAFLITSAILASLFRASTPTFGVARYRFDEQEEKTHALPLAVATAGTRLSITIPVRIPKLGSTTFLFRPDDCLDALRVNGERVTELGNPICLEKGNVSINLSPYFRTGANEMVLELRDFGGLGGVDVAISLRDPIRALLFMGLLLTGAIYGCTILWIFSRKKEHIVLFLIAIGALGLRLALATLPGHGFDTGVNQKWGRSAAILGIARSYQEQVDPNMLPDHPPLSIATFSVVTHISHLFSPSKEIPLPSIVTIKIPAIIADILTILLVFSIVAKMYGKWAGITASGILGLHPAIVYDSAIWGQTDSIFTLLTLGALTTVMTKRWILTGVLTALALFAKMQAIIVLPILGILLISSGWRPIMRTIFGFLLASIIVLFPFFLNGNIADVWRVYSHSIGSYPALSMGAYNIWMALFGTNTDRSDVLSFLGPLTYRTTGILLFSIATLTIILPFLQWILYKNERRKHRDVPVLLTALIAYAFFLFNTEMHERYLFPFMVLGLLFCFRGLRFAALYTFSSLLFLLSLFDSFSFSFIDRTIFAALPTIPIFASSLHVALFAVLTTLLLREAPLFKKKAT